MTVRATYVAAVFEKMNHEGDATGLDFSEISDLKNFGPDGRYECDEKLFREEEAGYRLYDLAHKIDGTQFEQQILEALLEQGVIGEKRESEDEESEDVY